LRKRYLATILGGALVIVLGVSLAVAIPTFSKKKIHKPKPSDGPALEVLDSVRIPWGWKTSELSGLAWDQDEQLLYAVSDLGHIIHFKVEVSDNKIASVEEVFYGPLELTVGQETFHDTEDLVAINSANGKLGDSDIAVVFEDGPAAARFTAKGQLIEIIPLPGPLQDRASYRQANQRLESIAPTPDHGLIIGPQTPLVGQSRKRHTLYATDGTQWRYKAVKKHRTSTKALEQMPDGSLIVVEALNDGGFLGAIGLGGKEAHIRRLDLGHCENPKKCPVVDYHTSTGEPIRGRFEGITNIKDDLFLMVTDETFGAELMLLRIPPVVR
jgi:hypothetical protein